MPRDVAQALGGWASQGTDDDYGSGLGPAFLADYVGKVAFPALDLSHLHTPKASRRSVLDGQASR